MITVLIFVVLVIAFGVLALIANQRAFTLQYLAGEAIYRYRMNVICTDLENIEKYKICNVPYSAICRSYEYSMMHPFGNNIYNAIEEEYIEELYPYWLKALESHS